MSARLFVELTTKEALREWLPKLVGIERSVVLKFAGDNIRCRADASDEEQLTRDDVTASVHYVRWELPPESGRRVRGRATRDRRGSPTYQASSQLSEVARAELLADLMV